MVSISYRFLVLWFTIAIATGSVSSSAFAFEEAFFANNGKFSCPSLEKCQAPNLEEIEWIKQQFLIKSKERVSKLGQMEEKANSAMENILWRSQQSEMADGENNFSRFYKNFGSVLDKHLREMKLETGKVILSEGSPFLMELEDLFGVLTDSVTQRDQQKVSDVEKYFNWLNRPSFQQLLKEMNEVRLKFYINDSIKLSAEEKLELFPFRFVTCPNKLKKLVSKRFFSEDMEKNLAFYKRVLGQNEELLTIKCSPTKTLKKSHQLRTRYLKSTREVILPYKVGKQRSVSPVSKMFDAIK